MFSDNVALIWVDLQVDFMPTGMLPVVEADRVIPLANAYGRNYRTVVATQDWHPATHGSFAANHPWRRPGQVIDLNGLSQVLWPIHCVQHTWGAEFVASLETELITEIFRKGTDPEIDSYSGFFDNGHRKSTGLAEWLRQRGVDTVHVLGVATDYCVKFTVLDAIGEGFNVSLLADACRGVDLVAGDVDEAVAEMLEAGAEIVAGERAA
ncbi:bifunctional nicotinamidase/pyrazinamidase [Neolewinella antarctica]|uniref:nicotinamidase n=1 Tax=Neolewinella antarctica TaxID=442734 RepID=A0ABX0X6G2_9BACT|nr:bifunctional nicotinamidase/pyrazinamidase [Neolewinella antarctica]NJC24727.1 nicotinamidase/pyrazinamidase [Neolewinella antarctica]